MDGESRRLLQDIFKTLDGMFNQGIMERTNGTNTVTSTAATGNGTIAAGAKSISIVFSSDWVGDFGPSGNQIARLASSSINIGATLGKTLPAFAYTRTAGTAYIDVVT